MSEFRDIVAMVIGGGLLIQIVRLSCWVGELKTKVDVMWQAMTNELHMDLESKCPTKKER